MRVFEIKSIKYIPFSEPKEADHNSARWYECSDHLMHSHANKIQGIIAKPNVNIEKTRESEHFQVLIPF